MAAATIIGGAALAGGALQTAQGMRQASEARSALNNFERQELTNVYQDVPISLLGSNLRREDASQTTANLTQAAQGAGIRGVFGALPRIQAQSDQAARQNQLDVDSQVTKRNYSIAGDEARIQQMQEARDNADLAGLGQQLAVGQQNTMAGISSAFNGLAMAAGGMGQGETPEQRPETQSASVLQPMPANYPMQTSLAQSPGINFNGSRPENQSANVLQPMPTNYPMQTSLAPPITDFDGFVYPDRVFY